MRKTVLGVCLSGLMIISVLTGCVGTQTSQTKSDQAKAEAITHLVDSAKIVTYDSADQVIEKSKLIVEVTKVSEEAVSYSLGSGRSDNFTISLVKVNKLFKPDPNKRIQIGDTIKILESEWVDSIDINVIHHTEGYVKMKPNKEYNLYLGYNEINDSYYPLGLILGKIPKDTSEEVVFGGSLYKEIDVVLKELRSKHN